MRKKKKNLLPFIFTTQTQWQTNREEENCFFLSKRSDSINRDNINDLSSWFWLRCIELKTFCCVHLLSVTKTIVKCHTAKIKSNELKSFWLSSCYLTSYNKTQQQTKPSQVLYTKYIYKPFFSPVMCLDKIGCHAGVNIISNKYLCRILSLANFSSSKLL